MSKVIDVILRLKDNMTKPLGTASKGLQAHAREFQRAGRQIQRTGRKIEGVGKSLSTYITAPVVGVGAIAVKEFGEYDKQMRLVQQTMGSTNEESRKLQESLKKTASESVYTMQDGADAVLNYARAGFTAKQSIDLLKPSFDLAAGTGSELTDVTGGLSVVMKALGGDTKDAAYNADVLARAQAQAFTTVNDIFDVASKVGSGFETIKWGIEDLAVATGVLGDAGIKGAEAGTALKSGIANMTSHQKALRGIGVEIINADGSYKSFAETQKMLHDSFSKMTKAEQMANAEAIFGKHQMMKWLSLIKRSPEDIKGMEDALKGSAGTAGEMADALMSGPGGAIEKLKSNWDIFKKTVGESVAKVVTPWIEKITTLMDKFNNMSEEQREHILKIVGIIATVGPVLLIVGKLTSAIGGIVSGLGMIGKLGGVFGAIASPAGIVLGIIVAIGAAIVFIIKHWDKLKSHVMGVLNAFKPLLETIKNTFEDVFGSIKISIQDVTDFLVSAFGLAFDAIKQIIEWITPLLESIVKAVGNVVKKIIEKINHFRDKLKEFYNEHKEFCDGFLFALKALATGIGVLIDFVIKIVGGLFDFIGDALGSVMDVIEGFVDGLMDTFGGILTFLKGVFTLDFETIVEGIKGIFDGLFNFITGILKGIANLFIDIFNLIVKVVNAVTGWIPYIFSGGEVYDWIPEAEHFATGTSNWKGGICQINERGGEIVDLPSGSRIYPHDKSVQQAFRDGQESSMSNSVSINIPKLADKIVVREDADIDKIANKLAHKLEKTSLNLGASRIGYQYQS